MVLPALEAAVLPTERPQAVLRQGFQGKFQFSSIFFLVLSDPDDKGLLGSDGPGVVLGKAWGGI